MWARTTDTTQRARNGFDPPDDHQYVPKIDCSQPGNSESFECQPTNLRSTVSPYLVKPS